jgi:hypothetical protein
VSTVVTAAIVIAVNLGWSHLGPDVVDGGS